MPDADPPAALAYATPPRHSPLHRWNALMVALAALSVLAAAGVLLPVFTVSSHVHDPSVHCAANLRSIGQGLMLYANENGDRYPDRIDLLITAQDMTSDLFLCPSTNHTRAPGATADQQAGNLVPGLHLSYAYRGGGRDHRGHADVILAHEMPGNHPRDPGGMNVLFGDGRVDFLHARDARRVLSELSAGHNPPPRRAI